MHCRLAKPKGVLAESLQLCLRDCLRTHATVKQDLKRLTHACRPVAKG